MSEQSEIADAARALGRRGGKAGIGASKRRSSNSPEGIAHARAAKTRRYVVARGISADLCGRCVIDWCDREALLPCLTEEERCAPGQVHLSHTRYQQIHPHPEEK